MPKVLLFVCCKWRSLAKKTDNDKIPNKVTVLLYAARNGYLKLLQWAKEEGPLGIHLLVHILSGWTY